MVGRRGDGKPPDQGTEQIRTPEVDFVYRLNRKYRKGFDYVRVWEITPAEKDPRGKARIELRQWGKGGWGKPSQMLLETFLTKNNQHNYIFAFESPKSFYDDQNIPIVERPTDPIRAFRDRGEEGLPPTEEDEPVPPEPEETPEPEPEEIPEPEEAEAPEEQESKPPAIREEAEYEEQKEPLEKALEEARLRFVQEDYEHSTKSNKLTKLLGLRPDVIPSRRESGAAQEYIEALKDLRDFEFKQLQKSLDKTPVNLRQQKVESFLLRYRYEEQATLYSLGKEVKSLAENETFAGKAKVLLQEVGNGYRQMSFKKKIAVGAGVIGLGALSSVGASVAGLAGLAYAARKVVVSAAAYLAIDEGANAFLAGREKKKASKEAEHLASEMVKEVYSSEAEKVASGDPGVSWEKLLDLTNEKLKDIDRDLQRLKTREKRVKLAALAGAVGLPAGFIITDYLSPDAPASGPGSAGTGAGEQTPSGNGTVPPGESPQIIPPPDLPEGNATAPVTNGQEVPPAGDATPAPGPETPDGSATSNPEASAQAVSLESTTVTSEHSARGLWGIIDNQLPESMPEAERNRVIAGVQNVIRERLEGLTDEQIQERYGFSSSNIDLIHPGETIKLNELVSQAELQQIIEGREVSVSTPEAGGVPPVTDGVDTSAPTPESPASEAPAQQEAATVNGVAGETAEQREARGYLNSDTIGFGSAPLTPEEQYWQDLRNIQGSATDPNYDTSAPGGGEISQGNKPEAGPPSPGSTGYTVEMSDYRTLLQDPAFEGRDIPTLQRESITLLNQELWDIDNTEFGPDHQFNNMTKSPIERQYAGRPIQELLAFDTNQYNYDPRPEYRQREWELRTGRGIYLDPINPGPTLTSPPDAYANATMDQIRNEYRQNIGSMAEAAIRTFGSAALPQNTLEHQETVREYMARIATLYTRARLENPNFRLNF